MADPEGMKGLVLAPRGRDASLAVALLKDAGIQSEICGDFESLERRIGEQTLFVIATGEAIGPEQVRALSARLAHQPSWSDLPFVILTWRADQSERYSSFADLFGSLGNVTFLERPFHPTTFISIARTALKGRLRQFEARSRIEELDEGDRRLRTALSAGRLGSWELDLTTRALTTDPRCKALFGRNAEADFGFDDWLASLHPEDRHGMLEAIVATGRTGADHAGQYRLVCLDGGPRWIEVRARLVRDPGRDAPRLVGVASDITARKLSEEALRQMNESLEDRVRARTEELERAHAAMVSEIEQREAAEKKLLQAQKLEMIGQLTGGVAHDFNNLLMAVQANLGLLRKHLPGDPRTVRLIDGALQGVQRGTALTQRLLAFARQQDLRLEPVNLSDLVQGMRELIARAVGDMIDVRIDLPPTTPLAMIEGNQIELAILNLVVNARDAMPDGGLLTISVTEGDGAIVPLPPARYVCLAITDTGHGMSEETMRKATEPFFSTKELGKGTGLGLSMVHGLALQLGGLLRLSSEEGQGTCAELWLPATTAQPLETVETPALCPDIPARMKILIVDDDMLIAMSTVDMLEDLGHEVLEANSASQALDLLREIEGIDLMITDYSMPRMNGMELARSARELRPDLPILLATGYAELPGGPVIDLPRIDKPYFQEELASGISQALNAVQGSPRNSP